MACGRRWRHSAASRQTLWMTQRVTGTITPASSAIGRNLSGVSTPSTGCCHRSRLSAPTTRFACRSTIGWNSSRNCRRSRAMCRSASRLTRLTAAPPMPALPVRQHAFDPLDRAGEALRRLQHQLVARGVAQRVVDQLEAIDLDENDRDALPASRAHLAQRTIELIHEVAAVRQPGEGVVVAGMLEAFLQRLVLLHLVEQPLVDRVQP